ncbi:MAG: dephospho-CoA kinase [Planctomycetota bacterium]|nr:MAG: dephospho-CoA kinase [Planctomycetota bacterium]
MTTPKAVPVIGLVGGIGAGKSSVARWLQQLRRVQVIDADRLGHEVLQQPEVRRRLVQVFGPDILDARSGAILRPRLAELVFGAEPERQANRRILENIVHPEIRNRIEQLVAANRYREDLDAIILDAAVLLESGWSDVCDAIAFLDVPDDVRWQRVAATRGWTQDDWRQRERSQLPLEEKKRRATWRIDNTGPPEVAARQLAALIDRLKADRTKHDQNHGQAPHNI